MVECNLQNVKKKLCSGDLQGWNIPNILQRFREVFFSSSYKVLTANTEQLQNLSYTYFKQQAVTPPQSMQSRIQPEFKNGRYNQTQHIQTSYTFISQVSLTCNTVVHKLLTETKLTSSSSNTSSFCKHRRLWKTFVFYSLQRSKSLQQMGTYQRLSAVYIHHVQQTEWDWHTKHSLLILCMYCMSTMMHHGCVVLFSVCLVMSSAVNVWQSQILYEKTFHKDNK